MAITTINEKLATIEYGDIFQPGLPISADGNDQADNQQLLWDYPGNLWTPIAVEDVFYKIYQFLFDTVFHRFKVDRTIRQFEKDDDITKIKKG